MSAQALVVTVIVGGLILASILSRLDRDRATASQEAKAASQRRLLREIERERQREQRN